MGHGHTLTIRWPGSPLIIIVRPPRPSLLGHGCPPAFLANRSMPPPLAKMKAFPNERDRPLLAKPLSLSALTGRIGYKFRYLVQAVQTPNRGIRFRCFAQLLHIQRHPFM